MGYILPILITVNPYHNSSHSTSRRCQLDSKRGVEVRVDVEMDRCCVKAYSRRSKTGCWT